MSCRIGEHLLSLITGIPLMLMLLEPRKKSTCDGVSTTAAIPCRSLLDAVQLPVAPDDAPRAAREAVGRWGERYVAAYLQAHAQPGMLLTAASRNQEARTDHLQCMPCLNFRLWPAALVLL